MNPRFLARRSRWMLMLITEVGIRLSDKVKDYELHLGHEFDDFTDCIWGFIDISKRRSPVGKWMWAGGTKGTDCVEMDSSSREGVLCETR